MENSLPTNGDHRSLDRLIIPEAKVYYRKVSSWFLPAPFKGPFEMKDISKSSLRFHKKALSHNDAVIELKILIPGTLNLRIKGRVAGPQDDKNYHRDYTLVHFLPFGSRKVYNSYRCKRKLDMIIEEFGQNK